MAKFVFRVVVHSKHENISWIEETVQKPTMLGKLFVQACAKLFLVESAILLLPEHRMFTKFELKLCCLTLRTL